MKKISKLEHRLALYSCILLFCYVSVFSYCLVREFAGQSRIASPIGVDFGVYYTTGRMVLSGDIENIYNVPIHHAALEENLNRTLPFYLPWLYPPSFLFIVVPISILPYPVALIIWGILTFALALYALYLLVPKIRSLALIACGVPGVFMNLRWGQNGFLNTALIGFGIYFLESNPMLAGLMFGLLTYKPQIALFSFIMLFITKNWKALGWAIVFSVLSVALSGAIFGFDTWVNFLQSLSNSSTEILESNWFKFAEILPSLLVTLRLAGLNSGLSYAVIGVVGVIVTLAARWIFMHTNRITLKGAVLVLGTFLVMPYFVQYDLMLLSIPLILLIYDCMLYGCRPIEVVILALLWTIPFLDWTLVMRVYVHVCPFILIATLVMVVDRVKRASQAGEIMEGNSSLLQVSNDAFLKCEN